MLVTVIGRHGCQPCRATVRRLETTRAFHQFLDVEQVAGTMWEGWIAHFPPGTSLPIVIVRDELGLFREEWTGYRPDRIDALAG